MPKIRKHVISCSFSNESVNLKHRQSSYTRDKISHFNRLRQSALLCAISVYAEDLGLQIKSRDLLRKSEWRKTDDVYIEYLEDAAAMSGGSLTKIQFLNELDRSDEMLNCLSGYLENEK